MKKKQRIDDRPTRYILKYGKSITEIAEIFGVTIGTVSEWNADEEKSRWLKNRLDELEKEN